MKRDDFLKTLLLAGTGVSLLPLSSWSIQLQEFTLEQLIGKGNPDITGSSYTSTMHKETAEALARMQVDASKAGIAIEVVSAYRSFARQKEIFENKYKRFTGQGLSPENAIIKIIEYSTIPGTSRHHWGTDLDLIDASVPKPENVLQERHFHGEGPYCKLRDWLVKNADKYGFYEVYTDNPNRKGFKYEPWHYSYAPVSKPMLAAYRELDIKQILTSEAILGSEHFSEAFISKYIEEQILDINPILL